MGGHSGCHTLLLSMLDCDYYPVFSKLNASADLLFGLDLYTPFGSALDFDFNPAFRKLRMQPQICHSGLIHTPFLSTLDCDYYSVFRKSNATADLLLGCQKTDNHAWVEIQPTFLWLCVLSNLRRNHTAPHIALGCKGCYSVSDAYTTDNYDSSRHARSEQQSRSPNILLMRVSISTVSNNLV